MKLEVETEFFLRTIEDNGAIPSKGLLEMDNANVQTYIAPDGSTRIYVRVDIELMTKSDVAHKLFKLKLEHLLQPLFA